MDFNSTVDIIIRDLNEAREIIDDLRNCPGVPVLQVELAKSKCKSAAEVIALLKDLKPQMVKEEVNTPPAHSTVQQPAHRPTRKKADSTIIADTFGNSETRLNEQLGSKREESGVTEMIKSKPVPNIGRAIGVNDKFLYIREIFDGNAEKYENAISQIDACADYGSAYSILQGYLGDVQENAVVKQLLELIRRKFPLA
jgi:hypothetical protein